MVSGRNPSASPLGPVLLAVAYTLVLEWSGRAQATPDRLP